MTEYQGDVVQTELAWAAGFFDGEGHTGYANRNKRVRASINQIHPEVLNRFRAAVGGLGTVSGPYDRPGGQPMYRYAVSGFEETQAAVAMIWKYLGSVKREQARNALATCRKETRPQHGKCRQGHPYEGNRTKWGQCRACMREDDRARRPAGTRAKPPVPLEEKTCRRNHPWIGNRNKWGKCIPCINLKDRERYADTTKSEEVS
jgi:hypothetical protein